MTTINPVHPLKTKAKILLSSVFGPYAQDDQYGSRKINPMELYHNQVTRVQGPFSLRMFHRSFGLMMIQENIEAPCTLLDFPTLKRFVKEIKNNSYDVVGISSIIPNVGKVKKMCELVRKYLPKAKIIVGGHIASAEYLYKEYDSDYIVKGDGIRWFRTYLSQDVNAPVKHPATLSAFGGRTLGINLPDNNTAAILIPSVGCPLGCNFCSTSALFGGKGKFLNFYESGDDLFKVMCDISENLKTRSFFVLDENFLLHRTRALRLLELMEEHGKSWSLYVFSSARALDLYTKEQLVRLGISWVWMGLEGEDSQYAKLQGIDTHTFVQNLQAHGIRVMGSTIIGLEHHTPENIDQVIDWAVRHDTDFHQFMLYIPSPGTPFYEQHKKEGTLLPEEEYSIADIHGQNHFNYRHKHIKNGQETEFLLRAFQRDFEVNGPGLIQMTRTLLKGYKKYKNHSNNHIRERFKYELKYSAPYYTAAIWAMNKWYKNDSHMSLKTQTLLNDLCDEFGIKARTFAPILGRVLYITIRREAKRLASNWTYEPSTFYSKNEKALVSAQ